MTKIDIFSGFLGAGKTTLIKKLIEDGYKDEKIVLIENEFGQIGVDKGFLEGTGIEINEMNSGCICCTLVGDFEKALSEVVQKYAPDRIIIEPSGVGKLSDVIKAVQEIKNEDIFLNSLVTVVDAKKAKIYIKNFGEFYINQIEHAGTLALSHIAGIEAGEIDELLKLLRKWNEVAPIITADWEEMTGSEILKIMDQRAGVDEILKQLKEEVCDCGENHEHPGDGMNNCRGEHHRHDHTHGKCMESDCSCHDHHGEEEHEHEHEHGHEHEHEHEHDHEHEHGHEHKHGHGHHHADEVFDQIGFETAKKFTKSEINNILIEIQDEEKYGEILRAKGIVHSPGGFLEFDYVPGEIDIRDRENNYTGIICVIGVNLQKEKIKELF